MTKFYNVENIKHLNSEFEKVDRTYKALINTIILETSTSLKEKRAKEYLLHGVGRRLRIINRCLKNISSIFPPEREDLLNSDELADVNINLHAFFINIYGVLDNLAWVVIHEKKLASQVNKRDVGLFSKKMKGHYSTEFQKYLDSDLMKKWADQHLINYRDALAHRIPLYVPPKSLTTEQIELENQIEEKIQESLESYDFDLVDRLSEEKKVLGSVVPYFTHSLTENEVYTNIHFQILADSNTIEQVINKFREMLKNLDPIDKMPVTN